MQRALIVDTDEIWRCALVRSLQGFGMRCVDQAADLSAACLLAQRAVDVLITEIVLGGEACYPLLGAARQAHPRVRLIAISDRASRRQVFRLLEYGVEAYFEKPISRSQLYEQLTGPSQSRYLPVQRRRDRSSDNALERFVQSCREDYALTRTMCEVLRCALSGLRLHEIAAERGVSPNTIKTQVRQLLARTGACTLQELRARAAAAPEVAPRA